MIVSGRITDASPRELTIKVPYDPRFVTQQWDEVQVDQIGDEELMAKYHLEPVEIDEKIARLYRLGRRKT